MLPRLSGRDLAQHQAIRIAGSCLPLHPWDLPHSPEASKHRQTEKDKTGDCLTLNRMAMDGKKDAHNNKCTDINQHTSRNSSVISQSEPTRLVENN